MANPEKIKLDENALDAVNGGLDLPWELQKPDEIIPDERRIYPPKPVPNPFAPQRDPDGSIPGEFENVQT